MANNLSGQRFGRLIAIRNVGSEDKRRIWEFLCDCGNTIVAKSTVVKSGVTSSCGCLAKELSSLRKRHRLLGMKFGRLTVKECAGPDKHGHVKWCCRCDCGGISNVTGALLVAGKTRSCGCLQIEAARYVGKRSKKENPVSKTKAYRSALRKRLRADPARAMAERISRMICHSLTGIGIKKSSRTFDMLGYSPEELIVHLERQFIHGMSWGNRHRWQIDHIIPISQAKTIGDVIALNQLSNLRPLWEKDNNQKRAQILSLL